MLPPQPVSKTTPSEPQAATNTVAPGLTNERVNPYAGGSDTTGNPQPFNPTAIYKPNVTSGLTNQMTAPGPHSTPLGPSQGERPIVPMHQPFNPSVNQTIYNPMADAHRPAPPIPSSPPQPVDNMVYNTDTATSWNDPPTLKARKVHTAQLLPLDHLPLKHQAVVVYSIASGKSLIHVLASVWPHEGELHGVPRCIGSAVLSSQIYQFI